MKKILTVILFLTVLSFASIANAANWEWITSDNKVGFFFDTQSFQKVDYSKNYTVWLKYQYTEAYGEKISKDFGYKEAVSHTLVKHEFDFKNQKFRILSAFYYSKSNTSLDYLKTTSQWVDIPPGSMWESVMLKTYEYYLKHY